MREFFQWFTHMENSKVLALILFLVVFVGILIYVYANKKRSARLESYKYIPLDDDKDDESKADHKVNEK